MQLNFLARIKVAMMLIIGILCLSPLIIGNVMAQSTNGRLAVTVKDPTDAVIAGATVTITNEGTNQQITGATNDTGNFTSPLLPVGNYTVTIEAEGYQKTASEHLKLDVGQTYGLVLNLTVGGNTDIITVEGGQELLKTTDSQVTNTVTAKQVEDLPINGRSPLRLVQLQAGVNGDLAATTTTINGQRTSTSSVTQDGVNIQDLFIRTNALDFSPNRSSVAQVSQLTVTTQNPGADVSGASAIRFVTPAGTNQYHGEVFLYNRNSAATANDFFSNQAGIEKPQLNRNQFGYKLGGPISIPGVINGKDKLFFFTYYESTRLRQGSPSTTTVFLPDARQGIFTYTDNNGQVRKLDILKTKGINIDPFIANQLSLIPNTSNTNLRGDGLNTSGFTFNKPSPQDIDLAGFRVDFNPTAKQHYEFIYQHASESMLRPDADTTFNATPQVSLNTSTNFFVGAFNYTFNQHFNNEIRIGRNLSEPVFVNNQDQSASAFFADTAGLITNPVPQFLSQGRRTSIFSIIDTAAYSFSSHFIKFGGQIDITRVKAFNFAGATPTFALGISTGAPDGFALTQSDFPNGISAAQLAAANSLLSYLGGVVSTATQNFFATSQNSGFVKGAPDLKRYDLEEYALYATDSWRIHPRLTVNYGLRYDYITPLREQNNLAILAVGSGQTDPQSIVLDPQGKTAFAKGGFYNADRNNFAPNISVAWDIPGLGRQTVLRGGYAIVYSPDSIITAARNSVAGQPGLTTTLTQRALFGTLSGDGTGLLAPAPTFVGPQTYAQNFAQNPGVAVFAIDPKLKTPSIQQYNITLEREIFKDTVVSVSYVGNTSSNLLRSFDFNQLDVRDNGFAADVARAQMNGALSLAANGVFNPDFDPTITGSQRLKVFPLLAGGGLLRNATIRSLIQTGEAGSLAQVYFTNNLSGGVKFNLNPVALAADVLNNSGSSTYNSLQIEGKRRFTSTGLFVQANYTFSKVLTDTDGTSQALFEPLLDNKNPQLEKARAPFDVKHSFKTNVIYELPFGPGKHFNPSNKIVQKLVGGFQVATIIGVQTGAPFSIFSGRGTLNRPGTRSANNTVDSSLTLDQIKDLIGVFKTPDGVFFINPSVIGADGRGVSGDGLPAFPGQVFFNPGPGQLGSLGRLEFSSPTAFNMDFSVIKRTSISERVNVEFRAEFFNVLNHPIFFVSSTNTTVTSSRNINSTNFGQLNDLLISPRVIQFAAKINF